LGRKTNEDGANHLREGGPEHHENTGFKIDNSIVSPLRKKGRKDGVEQRAKGSNSSHGLSGNGVPRKSRDANRVATPGNWGIAGGQGSGVSRKGKLVLGFSQKMNIVLKVPRKNCKPLSLGELFWGGKG